MTRTTSMCASRYALHARCARLMAAQGVLEKQADIIRFMKQHNESLSHRIRTLTEQLAEYERGGMG